MLSQAESNSDRLAGIRRVLAGFVYLEVHNQKPGTQKTAGRELPVINLQVTEQEKELILFMRQLAWGELKVRVENGDPVLIYEAIRTLKLGEKNKGTEPLGKAVKKKAVNLSP